MLREALRDHSLAVSHKHRGHHPQGESSEPASGRCQQPGWDVPRDVLAAQVGGIAIGGIERAVVERATVAREWRQLERQWNVRHGVWTQAMVKSDGCLVERERWISER